MAAAASKESGIRSPKVTFAVAITTMLLLPGCGGGGGAPTTTGTPASSQPTTDPASSGSGPTRADTEARGPAPAQAADKSLASSACKALPFSAAESFDPHFTRHLGGGDGNGLSTCSYNGPSSEHPSFQLILELIPPPTEPSEAIAKRLCHKLIGEISRDPDYEGSETVPGLGEESNVATGFVKAESNLDEDETIYVADWREAGSCARLIYSGVGSVSVEPLSKFIALAESISNSR